MTRERLYAALVNLGFPPSIVSFDGPGIGECYATEHRASGWFVYYSERGQKRDERRFESESDALRYLLGWIIDVNR